MHLRNAQPRIPVYLSRAKDIKDAFKVCPTPDPCLLVEGQRHERFPGVPRTKSSILLTIRIRSPDLSGGGLRYWADYPQHWMLLTPSQQGGVASYLILWWRRWHIIHSGGVVAWCCNGSSALLITAVGLRSTHAATAAHQANNKQKY
jgi:hypothetical protein